jgi:hypothetical protein
MVLKITLSRAEVEQAIRDFIIDAIPTTRDMDFDILSLPYDLEIVVMERISQEPKKKEGKA